MPQTATLDFQQILLHPTQTYEEGLLFFRGAGLMNQTLRQLAKDLKDRKIDYAVIGGVALNQHGYRRFTESIEILLTIEGLQKFAEQLIGRGYRPAFEGAVRKFRATAENIPIKILITGDFPGDGKPKPVAFPDPFKNTIEIDGIRTITLPKLVELKLSSGLTRAGRRRDLADVQELIRTLKLDAPFAEQLDVSVQAIYLELLSELIQTDDQSGG